MTGLALLPALSAVSCDSGTVSPDEDPIAIVTVTTSTDEIEIEGTADVDASVTTVSGDDVTTETTITWSSSNGNVASVSGTGPSINVIGHAPGTTIIQAIAGGKSGSATITVMAPAPDITTTTLEDGEVGISYSDTLVAAAGDGTFAWAVSAGNLPDGLVLNAATGEVTGTPTVAGTFDFTIQVTSGGRSDTADLSITVDPAGTPSTRTAVINVDFMNTLAPGMDTVYVGDDGIYSTTGGSSWNGSIENHQTADLLDEFGVATAVDMHNDVNGGTFIGRAANELQDNGIASGGIPEHGFEWRDLEADSIYDLAFYIYAEAVLNIVTSFDVTHAGGTTTLGPNEEPTWALPGEEGKDYLLLTGVKPVELEPGVWGFRIENISEDGVMMGLQLRGPVRDP